MQTKEQQRSAFALANIGDNLNSEEANFWVGLPTLILENGLGQSMAFLMSKAKKADKHQKAVNIIRKWLNQEKFIASNSDRDFLQKLTECDQHAYLQAQQESMNMLCWMKRYAKAFEEKK